MKLRKLKLAIFAYSNLLVCALILLAPIPIGGEPSSDRTPIVSTKYGQLRGTFRSVPGVGVGVATYLGVPYATPPVGVNRFSPTRTLSQWVGIHQASAFGPACPQRLPDIRNESAALAVMSKERLEFLKKSIPILKHQSEDCLYLNIYVPQPEFGKASEAYPVLVFVPGPSYEFGSASLYDGSIISARGRVIVVTLNYRLGLLGFFNPNADASGRATVANYGLMDQLAALHWVQENIVRFGGDPGQVTVMGHGTGAACLNFLVISPAAAGAGLFKRAILMSGSALSPWAWVERPAHYAIQAATQLGCEVPDDIYMHYESLLHCLRDRTVEEILEVEFETPQFRSSVGPSIDGVTIKPGWQQHLTKMGKEGRTPVDILMGVDEMNIYQLFNEQDATVGFDVDQRDRILRTYVANNYRFHLQEILLAITAEYTEWDRPIQHETTIRDMTAGALNDASYVAPSSAVVAYLSSEGRSTYFYVFSPQRGRELAKRELRQSMNELPYVFGEPLGASSPLSSPFNYSRAESALSEAVITYWTNFVKTGNPNDPGNGDAMGVEPLKYRSAIWPMYDSVYKKYFELDLSRGRSKDHYRAGHVALWTWLLPGLERVGARYGPDSPFHRLADSHLSETFSGPTRPWGALALTPTGSSVTSANYPMFTPTPTTFDPFIEIHPPMHSGDLTAPLEPPPHMIAEFPYTTALSLTVAIGCSLLVLNLLVFAAVYYRRDPPRDLSKPGDMNLPTPESEMVDKRLNNRGSKTSPSHCGTLRSSATLRSSLATSCEGETPHEWPPDYTTCCTQESCNPPSPNGTTTLRNNGSSKPPPPVRSSSVLSHVEAQPLLSPAALLQEKHLTNSPCTEIRL